MFTGTPDAPISLTVGNRYYLGISPITDLAAPEADAISAQYGTKNTYTDGQMWAIRLNRYEPGVTFIDGDVYKDYDFNMSIGFASAVPIPSAVWLFGSGLIGLIGIARRKKS